MESKIKHIQGRSDICFFLIKSEKAFPMFLICEPLSACYYRKLKQSAEMKYMLLLLLLSRISLV